MRGVTESALLLEWLRNPEPLEAERDPRTIVETDGVPMVWNSENETEEWLRYDGEPLDIEQ